LFFSCIYAIFVVILQRILKKSRLERHREQFFEQTILL